VNARLVASQFLQAHDAREPIERPGSRYFLSEKDAYAVQRIFIDDRGRQKHESVCAIKLSLTSEAAQARAGTDQPTYGALTPGQIRISPARLLLNELISPAIEPEVVFRFLRDLGPAAQIEDILSNSVIVGALEIPDSRIKNWLTDSHLNASDIAADNSLAGRLVLSNHWTVPTSVDLSTLHVTLCHGGSAIAQGHGVAVLGNPLRAVSWLIRRLAQEGNEIKAGMMVSSGTFCPPVCHL
jgi:2-keto-4-pentenoate hydratase